MRYSFILILVIIFGCQTKYDVPITIELKENWEFRQVGDSLWHKAMVPGNVFSDLLDNELIEDPLIGDHENKVQWVSGETWEYRTSFSLEQSILSRNHLELNFEGLDTYASVYLNDSLILKANNAFRHWNIDVKPILKLQNTMRIIFEPTSNFEEAQKAKLSYELPEGNRVFTRKAQFQYGWDWAPKLNTTGIWRSIEIEAWDDFKIEDMYVKQLELNDDKAHLILDLSERGPINTDYQFNVYVNDSLYLEFKNPNPLMPVWIPLTIENPKLWWPHNLGKPYLYDIKVALKDGRRVLDTLTVKKGLRTIDLVTEKDSLGESFYFKVNGKPIYAKGANYIPQHSFQNEVKDGDYNRLLTDVVDANMNMLRVWGGGIYEDDLFYELCDAKGILVWQDFIFACAMYPGDNSFLSNVAVEAEQQVRRLRNHASLALWCGNNENSEGWHRWGWQANRSDEEKDQIWNNYLKVFDSILPNTVRQLTDVAYWESSPKYGRGNPKYKTEGDAHDWWVWHDGYPFEHYENHVPRFMSEFGFQSLPSYETVRYINQNDSLFIDSDDFKNHQKHRIGFQRIEEYMERDVPIPNSPKDYIYMSQLVQAYGITKGIEAHRRAKPYNMGTLYWQLNDCWPSVSWSSIDFFGNWKALHYKAKRSFENVLVSSKVDNDSLQVWVINDNYSNFKDSLTFQCIDFKGNVLKDYSKSVVIPASSSNQILKIPLHSLPYDLEEVAFISKFNGSRRLHWLVAPKKLKLNSAPIYKTIKKDSAGYSIELSSTTLQKDVFLFSDAKGHFSDNFFDMLPNETYTVFFRTSEALNDVSIISFNNFIR
jgi:beta-mannosidase